MKPGEVRAEDIRALRPRPNDPLQAGERASEPLVLDSELLGGHYTLVAIHQERGDEPVWHVYDMTASPPVLTRCQAHWWNCLQMLPGCLPGLTLKIPTTQEDET